MNNIPVFIQGNSNEVARYQNKLMTLVQKYGCKFEVHYGRPDMAQVAYGDRYETSKAPLVRISNMMAGTENMAGVYAVLHEIGHVIDYRHCNNSFDQYIFKFGTLELEVRAWEHAFRMGAQMLTAKQLRELKDYALTCLGTYNRDRHDILGRDYFMFDRQDGDDQPEWEDMVSRVDKALKLALEVKAYALLRV